VGCPEEYIPIPPEKTEPRLKNFSRLNDRSVGIRWSRSSNWPQYSRTRAELLWTTNVARACVRVRDVTNVTVPNFTHRADLYYGMQRERVLSWSPPRI